MQNYKSKFKMIVFVSSFTLLLFYSFTLTIVHAQEGDLIVAPARQQITVDPGDTKTFVIKFLSKALVPISGKVGVADFIVNNKEGLPIFLDSIVGLPTTYTASSWVKLPFEQSIIPPTESLMIQSKITVPMDAKPGGKYFGVYFEPSSTIPGQTGSQHEAGSSIQPRLAGLIYLRVSGPISEKAIVSKFDVPIFVEFGPVNIITEILNRGDYHITPQGEVSLSNWFGKKIDQSELKEINIFPDASRIYENKIGRKWLLGRYKVDLTASYGESGQAIVASAFFWAFPIRIVLVIILGIIIIILLSMIIWKKVKGRQSKLEKKLEEEIHDLEELKEKVSDKLPTTIQKK